MATNPRLDKELIAEARRLGNHPTKRATVEAALHEYVQRRKQLEILELFGQIDYEANHPYKAARSLR